MALHAYFSIPDQIFPYILFIANVIVSGSTESNKVVDFDWKDECRDAIACRLVQGDLAGLAGAPDPSHHKRAQELSVFFDMKLLKTTMDRLAEFENGLDNNLPDEKFKQMKDELAKIGAMFYPQNNDELKKMLDGNQAIVKSVKRHVCQSTVYKCAGEIGKMKASLLKHVSSSSCGTSGWEASSYVYFNCSNIAKWPPAVSKLLRFDQTHCVPMRIKYCRHPASEAIKSMGVGPEKRAGFELAGPEAFGKWETLPPDSPECQPHGKEYKPPDWEESPWFGEFKCGKFVSNFDGSTMQKRFFWKSRAVGKYPPKKDDWGDWEECAPGAYATSFTLEEDDYGVQGMAINCEPPRYAILVDEKYCNGPLVGLKVHSVGEDIGEAGYLTHVAGRCGWTHPIWLNNFQIAGGEEILCGKGEAICAWRFYKRMSEGGELHKHKMGPTLSKGSVTYEEQLSMMGSYIYDIQIQCCALEYPCNATDMFVSVPELGGDFSLQPPETFSRLFIVGVDTKKGESSSGTKDKSTAYCGEASLEILKKQLNIGFKVSVTHGSTTGHSWGTDSALSQKEATWTTENFAYEEGLLTRYFRALGVCGVGRVWSADKPFPVTFVSTSHCTLSNVWNFVRVVNREMEVQVSVGVNCTTPRPLYFTGPPYITTAEVSHGLETRLVGEFEIKLANPTRTGPNHPYLGQLKNQAVHLPPQPTPFDHRLIFQRVVRCSAPKKPEHYILVHGEEVSTVVMPLSQASGSPTDEYRRVRQGFRDEGTHEYNITLGITWPELTKFGPFTSSPSEIQIEELTKKVRPVLESMPTSDTKYKWSRNKEWHLKRNAGHVKTLSVDVKEGEEVEVMQVVGIVGPFTVFTDHVEIAKYDKSDKKCIGGTGIFGDCSMTKFRE